MFDNHHCHDNLVAHIQETRKLVDEAYARAKQLLQDNLLKLEKVKEHLHVIYTKLSP